MADIDRTEADARPTNDILTLEVTMYEDVEAGQLVYIRSDGKGAIADASSGAKMPARGWATMSTLAGRAVALVTYGKVGGYESMTPGAPVYASDTAGEIADAAGTVPQVIGYSVSDTDIVVDFGTASEVGPSISSGEIDDGAVTKAKLAGSFLKVVLMDGQDETGDATITVTGLAVGDELVAVIVLAAKASIATAAQRALTDYTVSANTLTIGANAANNAANQYLIFYLDLT